MEKCIDCGDRFVSGEYVMEAGQPVCWVCLAYRPKPEPVAVVPEPVPARVRCPHYSEIKQFFAVAREMGMDTSKAAKDRCRGAVGMLLGRKVASRAELSGAEWAFATSAVRMGRLFW